MKRDDVVDVIGAWLFFAVLAVMLWFAFNPGESDPITHSDYPPCTVAAEEAGFC